MDERIRIEANIVKGEERFYIDQVKGVAVFFVVFTFVLHKKHIAV